jgi:Na+/melibiose symporter-like transporter
MYDCCDVYHLATGEQKEGEMLALQNLAQTAGEAIATLFLGWGLQLFGYTGGEAVTPFLQKVIWSFGTIVPGIFIAISMIFLLGYNLTRKDFDEVTQAIADRDEGKEIDMSRFDHLI